MNHALQAVALPTSGLLPLPDAHGLVSCLNVVRRIANELTFSVAAERALVTAAQAVACILLRQGGGGNLKWELVFRDPVEFGIRLILSDRDAGRLRCYVSMGQLEVDQFSVRSMAGGGVKVILTQWAGRDSG